jgi:hypothetical protein
MPVSTIEIPEGDIGLLLDYITTRLATMPERHEGAFRRLQAQLMVHRQPTRSPHWRDWVAQRVEARHP